MVVLGEIALELQHAVAVGEAEIVEMGDCMRHAARMPVLGVVDAKLEEAVDDDGRDKDGEVVVIGEGKGVDEKGDHVFVGKTCTKMIVILRTLHKRLTLLVTV